MYYNLMTIISNTFLHHNNKEHYIKFSEAQLWTKVKYFVLCRTKEGTKKFDGTEKGLANAIH